jgi:uncharacterized membrane protein
MILPGWHPVVVHFPLALVVSSAAATAALIVTGYRGGQNVYRYGVGVQDRIATSATAR